MIFSYRAIIAKPAIIANNFIYLIQSPVAGRQEELEDLSRERLSSKAGQAEKGEKLGTKMHKMSKKMTKKVLFHFTP